MATLNQPFSLGSSKGMTGRITVTQVMDIQNNKSQVSIALEFKNTSYFGHQYYLDGSISVDGSKIVSMSSSAGGNIAHIKTKDTFYEVSSSPYTTTVSHLADGSKTITVSVSLKGYERNGAGSNGFSLSKSTTVVLDTIPRASTVAATDANIGSVSMIAVNRKSTTYTHSIHFTFGDESGYITADGGISPEEVKMDATSIAFTVPNSFYAQIPDDPYDVCSLVCKTYADETQIGDDQPASFKVTADEALCEPQVSGTVEDINPVTLAITGDPSKFIRFYSEALCTISATARNEASIKTKTIDGTVVEGNTHTISGMTKESVVFSATDTRDYPASVTVPVTLIPYIQLTCVPTGKRKNPTDGTAEITVKGNYYNGSLGGTDNALTLQYRNGNGAWQNATPNISGNSYTATISLEGLTYTESFTFEVKATDKVTSAPQTVTIGKGIPIFDWGENDFAFHVPVHLNNGAYDGDGNPVGSPNASAIADLIYPVGSIYMSVNAANPTTLFGGEWEQLQDTFLLAAGSTYANGATGGEAEHKLTEEELPNVSGSFQTRKWYTANMFSSLEGAFSSESISGDAYSAARSTNEVGYQKLKMNFGGDKAHNNMPPYLAVYMWKRTA